MSEEIKLASTDYVDTRPASTTTLYDIKSRSFGCFIGGWESYYANDFRDKLKAIGCREINYNQNIFISRTIDSDWASISDFDHSKIVFLQFNEMVTARDIMSVNPPFGTNGINVESCWPLYSSFFTPGPVL